MDMDIHGKPDYYVPYRLSMVFLNAAPGEVGVSGGVVASRLTVNFTSFASELTTALNVRSSGRPDVTS